MCVFLIETLCVIGEFLVFCMLLGFYRLLFSFADLYFIEINFYIDDMPRVNIENSTMNRDLTMAKRLLHIDSFNQIDTLFLNVQFNQGVVF